MAVRTRAPNTAARARGIPPDVENHTRQILESILRPHSLKELYALVGSFPFKAVRVASLKPDVPSELSGIPFVPFPVGRVATLTEIDQPSGWFIDAERTGYCRKLKQWRLAE